MSQRPQLRKKLYVSGAIQGRILRRFTLYWVLYHLLLWHALFLTTGLLAGGKIQPFFQAYWAFFEDNWILLLCAAVVFPLVFGDMLKMTNKIAGPLVRFERALRAMSAGQRVEPLAIQKDDMVHEFLDVFNQFIERRNQELAERSRQPDQDHSAPRSEPVSAGIVVSTSPPGADPVFACQLAPWQ
jgi:hypothetical protein